MTPGSGPLGPEAYEVRCVLHRCDTRRAYTRWSPAPILDTMQREYDKHEPYNGAKLQIAPNPPLMKRAVGVCFPPEVNDVPMAMQGSKKHVITYLVIKYASSAYTI